MNCPGLHCDGCGQAAGGGLILTVVAVALAARAGATLAEDVTVAALGVVAAAVLVGIGFLLAGWKVVKAECDLSTVAPGSRAAWLASAPSRPAVAARRHRPALERPAELHQHLHLPAGMSADDVAALITRRNQP